MIETPGPERIAALRPIVDGLESDAFESVREQFVKRMFLATDDGARRARIIEEMSRCPQDIAAACGRALVDWDGEAAAMALKVPALAIFASGLANEARRLRALNPFSRAQ
jgi:hypothetical protein